MSLTRVKVSTQDTITRPLTVGETLTDATGSVTYTVTRLDGTAVTSGTATHGTVGVYSFVLPPQSQVDMYVVVWTGTLSGAAFTITDYVEIVGDFICSLTDMRNAKPVLDPVRFTTQNLIDARLEAEMTAEDIVGEAFVRRFGRYKLTGNNAYALPLDVRNIKKVRAVSINGVALSAPDLANVGFNDSGLLTRWGAWWQWWTQGNVIIEVEHGRDFPPEYIRKAIVVLARSLLTSTDTAQATRATTFTVQDGGTYRPAQPDAEHTGIPLVDAALARVMDDSGGFA